MTGVKVLGIDIASALVDRWVDWWMLETHPFVVPAGLAAERAWPDARSRGSRTAAGRADTLR